VVVSSDVQGKDFGFRYSADVGTAAPQTVFAAWNPSSGDDVLRPGVKVLFFGSTPYCEAGVAAGQASVDPGRSKQEASRLTGLSWKRGIEHSVLTPTGDPRHCHLESTRAGSFVALDSLSDRSGVGLYTTTGPDRLGRQPFVGPFVDAVQAGSDADVGILGTFVLFRLDWEKEDTKKLWSVSSSLETGNQATMDITTTQSVATAGIGAAVDRTGGSAVKQVKQQLTITLINRDCRRAFVELGELCQLQYLFTVAIFRRGVDDWSKVDWFRVGHVWTDPAQGGIPVVDGPIEADGASAKESTGKFDLYSSGGAPTGHEPFKNRRFEIHLGIRQLCNALRLVAAKRLSKAPVEISTEEIARIFGSRWDNPLSWAVLQIEVAQEVYNPGSDVEAHIGGSFTKVAIAPGREVR
jgi:hypothetical protein